ncbi:MAG: prepilin-type N-terminal cleavage/methylation domain-containing protein [Acidobacteria bacterium]|nr:prepilin-type N-terminal cleavage/methylation domain-containing protein [Acidobacteriota bacterium]
MMRAFRRQHSIRGFSLVEILIVVLLITLIAGFGFLSIGLYRKSTLADVAASNLSQAIRRTRENAITQRVTFRMRLIKGSPSDPAGDQYIIERFPANPAIPAETVSLPEGWKFGKLPGNTAPDPRALAEIPFVSNQCDIIFKGDGYMGLGNGIGDTEVTRNWGIPPLNGTVFIYDNNEPDQKAREYKPRAITVLGATGRTSVWRLYKDEWIVPGKV